MSCKNDIDMILFDVDRIAYYTMFDTSFDYEAHAFVNP